MEATNDSPAATGSNTDQGATKRDQTRMMRLLSALDRTLERAQKALTRRTADMNTRQLRAFLMLAKASMEGEPFTTEDLRKYLNLSSSLAHKTVTYFVDNGFVEKQVTALDGRAKALHLTRAGAAIAEVLIDEYTGKRECTCMCDKAKPPLTPLPDEDIWFLKTGKFRISA